MMSSDDYDSDEENEYWGYKKSPMTIRKAVRKNNIEEVYKLLKTLSNGKTAYDLDKNVDVFDDSLLQIAAKRGFIEVMRLLLDEGGIDAQNDCSHGGTTPLLSASSRGKVEACELLLDRGAHVDHGTEWGYTPLRAASESNQLATARFLISRGADVDLGDNPCGTTPLHDALRKNYTEIVRLLLDSGCELDEEFIVPNFLETTRRGGRSVEDCKKIILDEIQDRKIRKEFDNFNIHHIEYRPYKDKIYSTCYPTGNIKVTAINCEYRIEKLKESYYYDNNFFYTIAKPPMGWEMAKALRDKFYFDDIFFYIQCYVALNYSTSNNCRILIETSKETNEACTMMTILTNRLKLYLKPI